MGVFRRPTIAGIVFLALITVLAACGGGEATVAPTSAPTAAPPTAMPPTDVPPTATRPAVLSFFSDLLAGIPDTPDTRQSVIINDYAAVRGLLGLSPAGPDAVFPVLIQYAIDHIGSREQNPDVIPTYTAEGPFISGMGRDAFELSRSRREYLAFDGRNVDLSVEAGVVPFLLEVAHGRFDPAATAQALEACSECPPPDIVTHNNVTFYSWGEDGQGNLRGRNGPPAFDHLGRGGRIAVTSDYVYRTVETPGMKALIDSRAGDGPTLADVEEFRLLGKAMSDLNTYAAFFSDRTQKVNPNPDNTANLGSFVPGFQEGLIAEIGGSSLLLPYLAFSIGPGRDGLGPYLALALVHTDSAAATENKQRLERRISDNEDLQAWMEGLEEFDISVDGRVLSATLRGDGPASTWKALIFTVTPLVPHE